MRDELHISSLVVHARPDVADAVARQVTELPGAEVHQRVPTGKLIVTLETANTSEIMDRLEAINEMPGVISTALVYHQWEPVSTAESEPGDEPHAPQLPQS
jgi:periplasmic nitrate reductase NapD